MPPRRNFTTLSGPERTSLAGAFNAAKGFIDGIAIIHDANFNTGGIHWASSFLPWHRHVLTRLESEFAALGFPGVTVPYWDLTWPDSRSLDDEPWKSFFGGRSNSGGEFDSWAYTRASSDPPADTPDAGLILPVLISDGSAAHSIVAELQETPYERFRRIEIGSHVPGHRWTGGTMATGASPGDPLFWLHHCNLDRLWSIWQLNNAGLPQYSTADTIFDATTESPNDIPGSPDIALDGSMIGGATPDSMLNHLALGYLYPSDVRLEESWESQGLGTLQTGGSALANMPIVEEGTVGLGAKRAQSLLVANGHPPENSITTSGEPDGIFGSGSGSAAGAFRDAVGLSAGEAIDTEAWAELLGVSIADLTLMSLPDVQPGNVGPSAKRAQSLLAANGHPPANSITTSGEPDGIFGSGSAAAVEAFRAANDRGTTNVIDRLVWAYLLGV